MKSVDIFSCRVDNTRNTDKYRAGLWLLRYRRTWLHLDMNLLWSSRTTTITS